MVFHTRLGTKSLRPSRRETIPLNIHTHTQRWRKGTVVGQRMHAAKTPQKSLAVWLNCRVHKCMVHVHRACDRQAYACWDFPIPPFSPPSSAARKSAAPAHMRRWFDNVPPPYHPVNNDSYTRHLNTALRAVTHIGPNDLNLGQGEGKTIITSL